MRIRDVLSEAQNGQAFANLARAFHLPPSKVEVAVGAMVAELVEHIESRTQTRRTLASLVELLGQGAYTQVLETPVLLGATHTQVLGNDALKVIAGRGASEKIAARAAAASSISEMISEYLLPVIAAMLVGALAKLSGPALATILKGEEMELDPSAAGATRIPLHLPRASGGVGFSGSTGLSATGGPTLAANEYEELAETIRRAGGPPDAPDPAPTVRRVLASSLGLPASPLDWIERMHRLTADALNAILAGWRR